MALWFQWDYNVALFLLDANMLATNNYCIRIMCLSANFSSSCGNAALRELDKVWQVSLPANLSQWPTAVPQLENPLWLKKHFPHRLPLQKRGTTKTPEVQTRSIITLYIIDIKLLTFNICFSKA